jgi:hypothetical protein
VIEARERIKRFAAVATKNLEKLLSTEGGALSGGSTAG